MLIGGVVQDEFSDDADATLMGTPEKLFEIGETPVSGVNAGVVVDVVTIVLQR
jgi:hypothetical protein